MDILPRGHGSQHLTRHLSGLALLSPLLLLALLTLAPASAWAIPAFNRQTGQNCVACHAGGQFPELTPYGRLFKLTGYTLGERAMPVSFMAVGSMSHVANTAKSDDPSADFAKNNKPILATASLLVGGKLTDNIGGFAQVTYDPYAVQAADGSYHGHSNADNIDLRWADRFIGPRSDLMGVTVNNNPSVSDPWNTAAAWMQYVPVPSPGSSRFIDGSSPYPGFGAGGNLAGVGAYAYWNRSWYAEVGGFRTARGVFSVLSAGLADADKTRLRGVNPYGRLAYSREWGAHNLMLGTSAMVAQVYDDPLDTSDPATTHRYSDLGVDAQYQYLLDPHAVAAQLVYTRNQHRYPTAGAAQPAPGDNLSDTNHLLRAKLSYTYQARYGGSLSLFNLSGSTNPAKVSFDPTAVPPPASAGQVDGNRSGNPGTRGATLEAFWLPIQDLRIGAQYTAYSRFNGNANNYDGFGRNARDNNSLFIYTWLAY